MSVFVRQEKITVRIGLQSDPIDPTKTRLIFLSLTEILPMPVLIQRGAGVI